MSYLVLNWVRLAPNEKNPGLFHIRFKYILARGAKMYWNLIWKSPGFFSFGANLTHDWVQIWLAWIAGDSVRGSIYLAEGWHLSVPVYINVLVSAVCVLSHVPRDVVISRIYSSLLCHEQWALSSTLSHWVCLFISIIKTGLYLPLCVIGYVNHREKKNRYYLSSAVCVCMCVCVCMSLRLQPHRST